MIYCQFFKGSLKVYPGLPLLGIFLRDLNDGIAEGLQIFCHRFQDDKEGDMTAANQTPETVTEGAKDCNKLFQLDKVNSQFQNIVTVL